MDSTTILFRDLGKVSSRETTPEGFLNVIADFARSGIQEYYAGELPREQIPINLRDDPYSIIRLLRPDVEVFDEQSMKSFAHKPVTAGHPPSFIDNRNYRNYQIGFSKGKVTRNENRLQIGLTIQDSETIEKVNKGLDQLSAGYNSEVIWKTGNDPIYGPYDAIQTKIRGNHIAVVDKARGGSELKINDSWPAATNEQKGKQMPEMVKREINGITVEFSDQGAQAVDHVLKRLEATEERIQNLEIQLKDANSKTEKLQGELDVEKSKQLTDFQIEQRVTERLAVIDQARELFKDLDPKNKSLIEIKKEAIQKINSGFNLKDKSDEYVSAVFDAFYSQREDRSMASMRDSVNSSQTDFNDDIAGQARKRFLERSQNAWKGEQA